MITEKYMDFDSIVPRRGSGSYKWDSSVDPDMIPLWVADMDFKTAPAVIDALRRRVDHGVFGYTKVPEEYYSAVIDWFGRYHGWTIGRDEIIYTSGVVPALSAVIKALTRPGDKVIVQTPVYNCFFSSIRNNGCVISENPLVYADSRYTMDFDDLARRCADPDARLLLLCNPHNPGGRVWTADELSRLNDICMANGVAVVSDEIHCELTFGNHEYVPFASISGATAANSVVCCSPSKAFNTAGLQIANIVSGDPRRRSLIDRAINDNEVCDVNPFGVAGLIAAYRHGYDWLRQLKDYLYDNYMFLIEFFSAELPRLGVTRLEGTYLAWIDCRSTGLTSDEIERRGKLAGVWISSGTIYGDAGEGFIRINMATPRAVLAEGLRRLSTVLC